MAELTKITLTFLLLASQCAGTADLEHDFAAIRSVLESAIQNPQNREKLLGYSDSGRDDGQNIE